MHVNPIELTLTILLIAVLVFLQWRKKKLSSKPAPRPGESKAEKEAALRQEVDRLTATKPEDPPEVVYAGFRAEALATPPDRFAGSVADGDPCGALMELGIPSSVVTLACFADGDASLYYQTGGGMRGGIAHESVRQAAQAFIALAKDALSKMIKTTSQPLPGADRVRFYVLTSQGTYTTETDRQALGETQGPLSALFYAGQEVVAQMRQVQEERGR